MRDLQIVWGPTAITYEGKPLELSPTMVKIMAHLYEGEPVHWSKFCEKASTAGVYISQLRALLLHTRITIKNSRGGYYEMKVIGTPQRHIATTAELQHDSGF